MAGSSAQEQLPRVRQPSAAAPLLCRCLAATGVAAVPQEYFLAKDPAKMPDWRFWEEGPTQPAMP